MEEAGLEGFASGRSQKIQTAGVHKAISAKYQGATLGACPELGSPGVGNRRAM